MATGTGPPTASPAGTPSDGPGTTPPVGPVGRAPADPAATCSCELDAELGPAGPILVLRVAGEIDLLTLPVLAGALTAALDQRPADVVVDLAAVGFCCVRGFALLATAATTARSHGTGYALSGMPRHLDRFATLLWPQQRCIHYASVAAAVAAIRIDQTYQLRRTDPAAR